MKHLTTVVRALLGVAMVSFVTLAAFRAPSSVTPAPQRAPDLSSKAAILDAYGQLPLSFEANQGQTDDQVKFLARGSGYTLFLTATEAVLTLRQAAATEPRDIPARVSVADVVEAGQPMESAVLRLQLVQANPAPQVMGLDELPGKVNYFLGNDPAGWRTAIPTYAKVAYQEVYPGIDLIYYGHQGQLEYDFVVAPGADPTRIALGFAGAEGLALDAQGDLVLRVGGGEIRQPRPRVYQELGGVRQAIAGRYVLRGQDQVGIAVDAYDPGRPLVIDPMLIYSTFLGGTGDDRGHGIAVDSAGSAYVTGLTTSLNFPTTAGAFDTSFNGGNNDAFVSKLNPAGTALVYSTYLGGSGAVDIGFGIAVDSAFNAYVFGETASSNFPTTPGAWDTSYNGGAADAFVTKLNPVGSGLVYSTFLGGNGTEEGFAIALDSAGSAYVTGYTQGGTFPTTGGAFDTTYNGGGTDAFVTKLNPAGSAPLVYSTFLGTGGFDEGRGIAVDGSGSAYVVGLAGSTGFPTTPGAFDPTFNGSADLFVTQLNPAGSAPLVYSTYLGGSGDDRGRGIAVDSAGNAHVTGWTFSGSFPTTGGAFDTTLGGGLDPFVTKLNPTGTALIYSTFLGGSAGDVGVGIALDSAGNASVTGITSSADFPTTTGAVDTTYNGSDDVFVTKLNPTGSAPLVHSTYLGGSTIDQGLAIAVDSAGSAYVTGFTNSSNFPTTTGAYDTAYNGGFFDAFVTKIGDVAVPTTLTLTPAADTNPVGTQHCVTATVTDQFGNPVQNVTVRFTVTGSVNTSGSATTDASGQAQFCYTGPALPGADAIHAFADTDNDGAQDLGEPFDDATKTWVLPVTTPGCEIIITNGGWIVAANGDRASFGGNAQADADGNVSGQEEYQDHGPAEPFNLHGNVLAVVCDADGQSATIFGQATIDGAGSHTYRIDVQDLGEPGVGADTYRMRVNAYDSGEQTLQGGNVQIHN